MSTLIINRLQSAREDTEKALQAHLLPHQLVSRHIQVFPHNIVKRSTKPRIEGIIDKIQRVPANQRRDLGPGRPSQAMVAIAHQAVVGINFVNGAIVNTMKK